MTVSGGIYKPGDALLESKCRGIKVKGDFTFDGGNINMTVTGQKGQRHLSRRPLHLQTGNQQRAAQLIHTRSRHPVPLRETIFPSPTAPPLKYPKLIRRTPYKNKPMQRMSFFAEKHPFQPHFPYL